MGNVLPGVLTGLGTMFGFGLSDFFAAKSTQQDSPISTLFRAWIIEGLLLLPLVIWQFNPTFTPLLLFKIAAYSLILVFGYLFFYKSLEIGPTSIAVPLTATYPLATVILAILFFNEILVFYQYVAIGLIILGIFLTSLNINKGVKVVSKSGVLYALFAALMFGVAVPFLDQVVAEIGWVMTTFYQFPFGLLFLYLFYGLRMGWRPLLGKGFNKLVFSLAAAHLIGVSLFSFGLQVSIPSIVTPVSAAYPLVTLALVFVFFKERIAWHQMLGAISIILGIVLLAII